MTTDTEELMEGVLGGDSRALRELLARLRPHCIQKLFDRFAHLSGEHAEILDDAESLLFEWSRGPRARERLPRGEPLGTLAFRLVSQVARQRVRGQDRQTRLVQALTASGEMATELDPPAGLGTATLVAILMSLPEVHRETIVAEVSFQHGEGPPLCDAFGISEAAARKRLSRARSVFLQALTERKLDELMESETDDG